MNLETTVQYRYANYFIIQYLTKEIHYPNSLYSFKTANPDHVSKKSLLQKPKSKLLIFNVCSFNPVLPGFFFENQGFLTYSDSIPINWLDPDPYQGICWIEINTLDRKSFTLEKSEFFAHFLSHIIREKMQEIIAYSVFQHLFVFFFLDIFFVFYYLTQTKV